MGRLISAAQLIYGTKTFANDVVIKGKLRLEREITRTALASFKTDRAPGTDLGTLKAMLRSPSAWDIGPLAAATYPRATTPATWDLSGSLPVGTKSVVIYGYLEESTTAARSIAQWVYWNFDDGASNIYRDIARGLWLNLTYKPATAGSEYIVAGDYKQIYIGPSRKLYIGCQTGGVPAYAMLCDYSM